MREPSGLPSTEKTHRQPAVMIWEVALGVGGTAAVVVALVVLVAMCTVSRQHRKQT